jgi:hypothetical protein
MEHAMNRFLLLIILVAACVIGLAYYQSWFRIGTATRDGKTNVTLSVDTDKVQADSNAAVANVQDVGRQIKDKVAGPSEKSMDGTFVRFADETLIMKNADGTEHRHPLAANVTLICDGSVCKRSDVKEGMKIRVTTTTAEPSVASRIEAIDKNQSFASGRHRDGTFVSATAREFVMANAEGKEPQTHPLAADATITCDGKACKVADLKPGMRVRVTTDAKEPHAVTRIEALDRNLNFEKIV